MATEFTLPELGENIAGGDVVRVLVKAGDVIKRDQPVIELETDKATIEVPSSVEGTVGEVKVAEGQKIQVGQVVLTVDGGAEKPAAPPKGAAEPEATAPQEAAEPTEAAEPMDTAGREDTAERGEAAEGEPTAAPAEVAATAPTPVGEKPTAAAASTRPVPFVVPELGENVTGGDVVRVLVKEGDVIARDQPVVELETDKATFEVPSSVAGTVTAVKVAAGQKVSVGDVLIEVSGDAATAREEGQPEAPGAESAPDAEAEAPAPASDAAGHRAPSGDRAATEDDQWPEEAAAGDVSAAAVEGGLDVAHPGALRRRATDKPGMHEDALAEAAADAARSWGGAPPQRRQGEAAAKGPAPAAPSVRRTARELGVDIHDVKGSGPGGRISADDVKAHVKRLMQSGAGRAVQAGVAQAVTGVPAPVALPDFAKWGDIERQPMRSVRRTTAQRLSVAWTQIPHVTNHDKADVTDLEALRKQFGKEVEAAGGKLTVTAIAVKVVAAALRKFPQVNASIDMAREEIVVKKYVHVGIAVDTDRGLLVPVIRDADKKSITEISVELSQMSERARTKKTTLEEMEGGTFTITNLGGIGGTSFTPIVNYPEVAILGMSRSSMEPVWRDEAFEPRLMLPLSLSYDHRQVDGADAARFLRFVCEALEQPFLLALR
jgi:pyruvate dehydrogenase E2 component (dihydrolipoamide acetyltransferase)